MDENLTDSEMQALLSEVDSGDAAEAAPADDAAAAAVSDADLVNGAAKEEEETKPGERRIKKYDFANPSKFAKEHINTLRMIHETFARFFQTTMATYLRVNAEIHVKRVRQMTYGEYLKGLGSPAAIFVYGMEPLTGSIIMYISSRLIVLLIDRILGGPGQAPEEGKELTEIEQTVVEKIISRALDNYQEAWEKIGDFRPKFENFETNPGFVQIVAPNESCGVIDFNIKVNDVEGEMSVCLPYIVIEPLVDKLSTSEWFTVGKKASTQETLALMADTVKDTRVPLRAMVGGSEITIRDFMAMDKETVVRLDSKTDEPLSLQVGKSPKFTARPGLMGQRKVVKVVDVLKRQANHKAGKHKDKQE